MWEASTDPGFGFLPSGTMIAPAVDSRGRPLTAASDPFGFASGGDAFVHEKPGGCAHEYRNKFGGACCGNCEKTTCKQGHNEPQRHAIHRSSVKVPIEPQWTPTATSDGTRGGGGPGPSQLGGPVIITGDKCPDGYVLGKCYCSMCERGGVYVGFATAYGEGCDPCMKARCEKCECYCNPKPREQTERKTVWQTIEPPKVSAHKDLEMRVREDLIHVADKCCCCVAKVAYKSDAPLQTLWGHTIIFGVELYYVGKLKAQKVPCQLLWLENKSEGTRAYPAYDTAADCARRMGERARKGVDAFVYDRSGAIWYDLCGAVKAGCYGPGFALRQCDRFQEIIRSKDCKRDGITRFSEAEIADQPGIAHLPGAFRTLSIAPMVLHGEGCEEKCHEHVEGPRKRAIGFYSQVTQILKLDVEPAVRRVAVDVPAGLLVSR